MNDEMLFAEDEPGAAQVAPLPPWKVLIVDDEQSVHQVTQLVMSEFSLDNRGLQFIDCYSGIEAREVLSREKDIALILLDVVMETEHAGLDLVRFIREELKNTSVRIVLRTGQPGQAPQEHVIKTYDINDYKEKTDLTHRKLMTVFYSALRAYRDLTRLERARSGLRRSIDAITHVCDSNNLRSFCSAVLDQASVLLGQYSEGVCASRISAYAATKSAGELKVLAVTNAYASLSPDTELEQLPPIVRQAFERCISERVSHYGERYYACYYSTRSGNESFLFMSFQDPIADDEREMLEAFASNVASTYEKLVQREEMEHLQASTIKILGEALERHSGAHVRRVGDIAAMLAEEVGLSAPEVEQLRQAAVLHDVGQVGIADALLSTPGMLDERQWDAMREHTQIGHAMLMRSPLPVLQLAARIAHEHHERWDGTGYPRALAGKDISVEARVTAIADVIDALLCERSYRPAWSLERALNHVRAGSGTHFDPELVALLLDRKDFLHGLYQQLSKV